MTRYTALNRDQHLHHGWTPATALFHASTEMTAPVFLEELPHVIASIPLVFTRDNDQYELRALLSPIPDRNLFVGPDGRWLGGYIPASLRAYPFRALPHPESGQLTLCFDAESGLLVEDALAAGARPFFDSDGKPAENTTRLMEFLEKCENARKLTHTAVNALADADLLVPFNIQLDTGGDKAKPLVGVFCVDEKRLRKVSPDSLKTLQNANALPLAYAQMMSQHRLQGFAKLIDLHSKLPGGQALPDDITSLFSEDEGNLTFN
jgi:hypothetical protein